ncbi:MAG: DUF4912 domain-containing protein [Nitrospinae bacterium]|nr:DUF4912 domain-containing protein [Nitrospinota bacterium]
MTDELTNLTKAELMALAAKKKLQVSSSMKKEEIIKMLKPAKAVKSAVSAKASKQKGFLSAAGKAKKQAAKPAAKSVKAKAVKPAVAPVRKEAPKAGIKAASGKTKAKAPEKAMAKAGQAKAKPVVRAAKPVKAKPALVAVKSLVRKTPVKKAPFAPAVQASMPPVEKRMEYKTAVNDSNTGPTRSTVSAAVMSGVSAGPKLSQPKPAIQQGAGRVQEPVAKVETPKPAKAPAVKAPAAKPAAAKPALAKAQSRESGRQAPLSRNVAAQTNGRGWDIKIDEKKFFIADEAYDYPKAETSNLPSEYGDTRIIALARDPYKLYLYWELQGGAVERARAALGKDWAQVRWSLRIFDVSGLAEGFHRYFDVDVNPNSGSMYLEVDRADCEYVVTMGLKDETGRFEQVASSNRSRTPRAEASSSTDAEWTVPDDLFARIYGLSGGYMAGSGSLESSMFSLPGVSSLAVSSWQSVSSFEVSSFGASEQMAARAKKRGFFFWLDCELIVYGGTEPDAKVTMMGKKINLRPDGTFTARFFLPDGIFDIPVTAESSDGVEKREISPTVTRATRRKEEFLIPEEEWLKK